MVRSRMAKASSPTLVMSDVMPDGVAPKLVFSGAADAILGNCAPRRRIRLTDARIIGLSFVLKPFSIFSLHHSIYRYCRNLLRQYHGRFFLCLARLAGRFARPKGVLKDAVDAYSLSMNSLAFGASAGSPFRFLICSTSTGSMFVGTGCQSLK